MNDQISSRPLIKFLQEKSKHSQYQSITRSLADALLIDNPLSPGNFRHEFERWDWMKSQLMINGMSVMDIGANAGFFSFSAVEHGARHVTAVEGDIVHARFLEGASRILRVDKNFKVENCYFDFLKPNDGDRIDVIFCLNVLHHVGEDFYRTVSSVEGARAIIRASLEALSYKARHCLLQIGFNWKGNRNLPLFERGLKVEMIDFIEKACENRWAVEAIGIFNPRTKAYSLSSESLLERFDSCGEFLNRPLFHLKSVV